MPTADHGDGVVEREARKAKLSEAKQALLARRLAGLAPVPAIPRRRPDVAPPLSFAQQRLWFLAQLEPDAPVYNLPIAFRLHGALRVDAMERAWNALVRRHEALRTVIAEEELRPVQQVREDVQIPMRVVDFGAWPDSQREAEVRRFMAESVREPMNVQRGPLARAGLLRLSDTQHVLVVVIHHIVFDGWSVGVLRRELQGLYEDMISGRPVSAPALQVQYADFAVWQREWLQGAELERQLAFWRQQLGGELPILSLPTDSPRPAQQTFRGAVERFGVGAATIDALSRVARSDGATLFMSLLAAWKIVLARHSGLDDIIVGTPIANRGREELESLIGFFANTLVLRTSVAGDPTFRELVRRIRETCLGAYSHQDMPFERLVEDLRPARDLSRTPLFQVMFSLEDEVAGPTEAGGVTWLPLQFMGDVARTDMTMFLGRNENGVSGLLEYNSDLFDRATIQRLLGQFVTLLESASAQPDSVIWQLRMLTERERRQMLFEWNATNAPFPNEACIHELVERQAARSPDAAAVEGSGMRLTYRELDEQSNQLAVYLRHQGVGPEVIVAIALDRSPLMLVGMLGVLKAGGAYLPIDPAFPRARLDFMMTDSGAKVLVTEEALLDSLPSAEAVVCLDRDWALIAGSGAAPASPVGVTPGHLAYLIYTSGSTGQPKGVEVPHRAVVNFLTSMAREPGMRSSDSLLSVTTLSFDIAVLELFLPLTVGARVTIATRDEAGDGAALQRALASSGATVMQATPATWRLLLDAGWPGDRRLTLLCGGEALTADLAAELLSRSAILWNMYGPTETTVWSACERVLDPQHILIGRPIANTRFFVLDTHLRMAPIGVPGELYIGGEGVTRGYRGRDGLTAERFMPSPFPDLPAGRLYRTGDLVRFMADGRVQWLARTDTQIKLRGYRMELGEIESVLQSHDAIREAAAGVVEERPGDQRLVAYVVPSAGQSVTGSDLRRFLRGSLPEYMIPQHVKELETLPRTPNGKIDRRALAASFQIRSAAGQEIAPRTETERVLARIWCDVLGIEKVSVQDNFFDVGGHSLSSMQVIARIEQVFGRRMNPRVMILDTLAQIAAFCDAGQRQDERTAS